MKPKRRVSAREAWLVSLLPAALVFVVSLALPGPSDEVAVAEQRLHQLTGGDVHEGLDKQMRALTTQLEESRRELAALDEREAALRSRIQTRQAPVATRAPNMAQGLDELSRRLAEHGVQMLAMVEGGGAGRIESAAPAGEPSRRSAAGQRGWQVTVAATWPALREALAHADTFPQGLVLSAMRMEPPRPDVPLRRWELIVAAERATP